MATLTAAFSISRKYVSNARHIEMHLIISSFMRLWLLDSVDLTDLITLPRPMTVRCVALAGDGDGDGDGDVHSQLSRVGAVSAYTSH